MNTVTKACLKSAHKKENKKKKYCYKTQQLGFEIHQIYVKETMSINLTLTMTPAQRTAYDIKLLVTSDVIKLAGIC
jgi:hypothetical protein